MRVAIAHEWTVSYAGSERCVDALLEEFPDARLLTTLASPGRVPERLRRAEPSFLQHLPGATSNHEWLLPLMPAAWRLREPVTDVDVVVSSSHACAKAVRAAPGIPHVCYCHTPMRYAWNFEAEAERFPAALRPLARVGMSAFRRWDRNTAARVTTFVANSHAVGARIRSAYGRDAVVIHPPVDTDFFTPSGERTDDYLYVGRLVSYKRPEVAVEAFADLPHRLLVVGEGHLEKGLRERATPNVVFLGSVGPQELRRLYRASRALIFPGEEDFGISLAEAQACGTPVIAYTRGGAADILVDGVTGRLVESQEPTAFRAAVLQGVAELDPSAIRRNAERFSTTRFREQMHALLDQVVAGERESRLATQPLSAAAA